jgi:hypothetical protein
MILAALLIFAAAVGAFAGRFIAGRLVPHRKKP